MSAVIKLSSPATHGFWEIPVLFEDAHLLALDKPAGLLTSPDPDNAELPSLMKLLHAAIADQKPWTRERGLDYLNQLHQLDADATGVILLAKNKPAFIALADLFGAEKPTRKFIALVRGEPAEKSFEVDAKLSPHPVKPGMVCVDHKDGKRAKTRFEMLEYFPRCGYALVQCELLTDRPHQIRVHAAFAGLKMVGDQLYGGKPLWLSRLKPDYRLKPGREERPLLARVALHSDELNFVHPITNETVGIKAEWPKDFRVAVKYLRQYAEGFGRQEIGDTEF